MPFEKMAKSQKLIKLQILRLDTCFLKKYNVKEIKQLYFDFSNVSKNRCLKTGA